VKGGKIWFLYGKKRNKNTNLKNASFLAPCQTEQCIKTNQCSEKKKWKAHTKKKKKSKKVRPENRGTGGNKGGKTGGGKKKQRVGGGGQGENGKR